LQLGELADASYEPLPQLVKIAALPHCRIQRLQNDRTFQVGMKRFVGHAPVALAEQRPDDILVVLQSRSSRKVHRHFALTVSPMLSLSDQKIEPHARETHPASD
jgi:hypothetical protein